jgi:hypothetical protein
MKRQLGLSLVVLAVLSVPPAWSQTGSDQSQNDSAGQSQNGSTGQSQNGSTDQSQNGSTDQSQNGSTDQSQNGSTDQSQQSSTGPQVAYTHPEQLPPLTLLNEVTANTGIRLNLGTGLLTGYNSPDTSHHGYWQTLGSFGTGLEITQIRPTLLWDLHYNGGLSLSALSSARSSNYTSLYQRAAVDILWQFSPRWQFSVHDNYIYTNDPFEPYLTVDRAPTFNDPNPVIYILQSVVEQNTGSANLSYQMTQRDTLNFTGGESFQRFFNTTLSAQDSYTYSAGANYQHQFSARLSAGGGYSFTALDFGHGLSRSGIQAITGFASYQFTPNLYVTGWVGPEDTANKDIVPTFCFPGFGCFGYHAQYTSQWSVAEGATFGWSRARDAVRVGFRHQISNGGGLLGTVRFYQLTAGYRRSLTQRWYLFAGFAYNDSLSIAASGSSRAGQFLKSMQGSLDLSRNISPAWNATVYYSVISQRQNYFTPQAASLGSNGVGITLRYTWGHSLGR